MAKRKFTAKQLAAQKLFAKRAKAGTLKKKRARKNPKRKIAKRKAVKTKSRNCVTRKARTPRKKVLRVNPRKRGPEYIIRYQESGNWSERRFKRYKTWPAARAFYLKKVYDLIRAHAGLDTRAGVNVMGDAKFQVENYPYEPTYADYKGDNVSLDVISKNPRRKAAPKTKSRNCVTRKARTPRKKVLRVNPASKSPARKPFGRQKWIVRGQQKTKTGYLYYYLRGKEFLEDRNGADRFNLADGEAKLSAIVNRLPPAIDRITLEEVKYAR